MKLEKCPIEEYRKKFATESDCSSYLAEMKWLEEFTCKKCQNHTFRQGEKIPDRRCRKCGYNESPTANTIFHSIKLPLTKAFEMLYRICVCKKGISTLELSREFNVNPKTAYHFKNKIQQCMSDPQLKLLEGLVYVDEFTLYNKEHQKEGSVQKVVIALELKETITNNFVMGSAIAIYKDPVREQGLQETVIPFINETADIITNYEIFNRELFEKQDVGKIYADQNTRLPIVTTLVYNVRNWIRGIHHNISTEHIQKYLNEFCFRFNRRNQMRLMPLLLLQETPKTGKHPVPLSPGGYYG